MRISRWQLLSAISFSILSLTAFHFLSGPTLLSKSLNNTRYVANGGVNLSNDCTNSAAPCATVQHAVDVSAPGDEIRVAEGVYSDVHERAAPAGYNGPSLTKQMVLITKTLTIQGGYSTDFSTWDPTVYTSTLDAQQAGRVIFISGYISPTLDSLHITGGEATSLGGEPLNVGARDAGGGIYVSQSTATISNCMVEKNIARTSGSDWAFGGGLHLSQDDSKLMNNVIRDNVVSSVSGGVGGGVSLLNSDATLMDNDIYNNEASTGSWGEGAGLSVIFGAPKISGNIIHSNRASQNGSAWGGGLYVSSTSATIEGNVIKNNIGSIGGEVLGGGLYIVKGENELVNNVVMDNQADNEGGDIFIHGGKSRFAHNTIVRSAAEGNNAIHIKDWFSNETWGEIAEVSLYNTILANHATGISITGGNIVTMTGVLWYDVPLTVTASPTATLTLDKQYLGDPVFTPDGYHLSGGSAAINRGVYVGVQFDIDGDARLEGCIPDLGADEFLSGATCQRVYLPLMVR